MFAAAGTPCSTKTVAHLLFPWSHLDWDGPGSDCRRGWHWYRIWSRGQFCYQILTGAFTRTFTGTFSVTFTVHLRLPEYHRTFAGISPGRSSGRTVADLRHRPRLETRHLLGTRRVFGGRAGHGGCCPVPSVSLSLTGRRPAAATLDRSLRRVCDAGRVSLCCAGPTRRRRWRLCALG